MKIRQGRASNEIWLGRQFEGFHSPESVEHRPSRKTRISQKKWITAKLLFACR